MFSLLFLLSNKVNSVKPKEISRCKEHIARDG